MNFYVLGKDVDSVKSFFSVLPEDQRPRIVSDKDHPTAWDHPSDEPTVIVTDEPRTDVDAREIAIDGKQVDEVMEQMTGTGEIASEEPALSVPEKEEEDKPVQGPRTYADRGFRVGRIS